MLNQCDVICTHIQKRDGIFTEQVSRKLSLQRVGKIWDGKATELAHSNLNHLLKRGRLHKVQAHLFSIQKLPLFSLI